MEWQEYSQKRTAQRQPPSSERVVHTISRAVVGLKGYLGNEMKNDMVVVKRGLAVNINHIVDTDFETVVLSNGTKLKISDGYRNSVMDVLSDKIGGA